MHTSKRHDAAVAKADGAFARTGVGLFADGDQPIPVNDEPAIAGRVGGPESKHGNGRAGGQWRAQALERRRPNERRVAVDDQNIVATPFDRRFSRQYRVCRSTPLSLHKAFGARQNAPCFGLDRLLPRADDDSCRGDASFGDCIQHMRKQRTAGDGMQDLGPRRAHPRALASREHDCKTGSCRHERVLRGALIAEQARPDERPHRTRRASHDNLRVPKRPPAAVRAMESAILRLIRRKIPGADACWRERDL